MIRQPCFTRLDAGLAPGYSYGDPIVSTNGRGTAMAEIAIGHEGGSRFVVTVDEGGRSTTHEVTVWPSDVERYAPGATPEALVRASFEFLLAREPKESILRRFELAVIERYFPEYPRVIGTMVAAE